MSNKIKKQVTKAQARKRNKAERQNKLKARRK